MFNKIKEMNLFGNKSEFEVDVNHLASSADVDKELAKLERSIARSAARRCNKDGFKHNESLTIRLHG